MVKRDEFLLRRPHGGSRTYLAATEPAAALFTSLGLEHADHLRRDVQSVSSFNRRGDFPRHGGGMFGQIIAHRLRLGYLYRS